MRELRLIIYNALLKESKMRVNGKFYAIKITRPDGSVSLTAREGMATAYLVANPKTQIEAIELTPANVKGIVEGNSHGLWIDTDTGANEALIDCVKMIAEPSFAEQYKTVTG